MIDLLSLFREAMAPELEPQDMRAFAHSVYHDAESERLTHVDAIEEIDDPAGNLDD